MDQQYRKDKGKPRIDLVPIDPIIFVARVFEYGVEKYEENSWRDHPVDSKRVYSSIMRHMFAWHLGEEIDRESGLPHLDHAMAQIMILIQNEEDGRNTKETQDGKHSA